jgi:hypothetical protein
MDDTGTQRSVELYVRSLAPHAAVQSQLGRSERFESLVDSGAFESCTMHVVGRGIVHEGPYELASTAQLLRRRIGQMRAWAADHDATVPGLETTTVTESCLHETGYTVTRVPQNFLLEFEGDSLRRCSPAVYDGERFSVDDHLDALRASARASDAETVESDSDEARLRSATAAESNP